MKPIDTDELIEALDSVIWYNGHFDQIREWIDKLKATEEGKLCHCPDIDDHGLEVFWMLCVLMFGNYGTSPRSGWIEDCTGCIEFLKTITKKTAEYSDFVEEDEDG